MLMTIVPKEKSCSCRRCIIWCRYKLVYGYQVSTNHITGELEKLTMHEKYRGHDQVYTAANGAGMEISHIGQFNHQNPTYKILLLMKSCMFLMLPKTLLSVHRIALDNNVFLEFHPFFFSIKDQITKRILYRG